MVLGSSRTWRLVSDTLNFDHTFERHSSSHHEYDCRLLHYRKNDKMLLELFSLEHLQVRHEVEQIYLAQSQTLKVRLRNRRTCLMHLVMRSRSWYQGTLLIVYLIRGFDFVTI